MQIHVYLKGSDPSIDRPAFDVARDEADFFVACGRARWVPNRRGKNKHRRIQLLVEHRLDNPVPRKDFFNAAVIENGRYWMVTGQTPPGGRIPQVSADGQQDASFGGPSQPSWQMVM